MAISEYWRLSADLSVVQVALLVIGEDPELWQHRIPALSMEDRPKGYEAVISALTTDIFEERLPAKIFLQDDEWGRDTPPDWFKTTIAIGDLRSWLELKSMPLGFFQSPAPGASDYLNPDHSKYAPKCQRRRQNASVRRSKNASVRQAGRPPAGGLPAFRDQAWLVSSD